MDRAHKWMLFSIFLIIFSIFLLVWDMHNRFIGELDRQALEREQTFEQEHKEAIDIYRERR